MKMLAIVVANQPSEASEGAAVLAFALVVGALLAWAFKSFDDP